MRKTDFKTQLLSRNKNVQRQEIHFQVTSSCNPSPCFLLCPFALLFRKAALTLAIEVLITPTN